jgi:hypothetical protein
MFHFYRLPFSRSPLTRYALTDARFHRENQYKKKMSQWRREGKLPPKNIQNSMMIFMSEKAKKRKAEEDKDTNFHFRGWSVVAEKIRRFEERYETNVHDGNSPSAGTCPPLAFELAAETTSDSRLIQTLRPALVIIHHLSPVAPRLPLFVYLH